MRVASLIAIVALGLMLAGCGGGGSAASPFRGQWAGTWVDETQDVGNMAITVARDGRMSGAADPWAIAGTIASNGGVVGTLSASGLEPMKITGGVRLLETGELVGVTTAVTTLGESVGVNFLLVRQ